MNQTETAQDVQKRHRDEVNNFEGLFFALNNKQLKEGLEKVGLNENDTDKIVSIGAGGYLRKDRIDAFKGMFKRRREELKQVREQQETIDIMFAGVDSWNRPVFKSVEAPYRFYGSVNVLFDYSDTKEDVLNEIDEGALCYFGRSFDCEPMGTTPGNIKIVTKK